MKKTGAQIITKLLEMHGIETVAGIPGGSILPLYDELTRSSIHHVLVRQEHKAALSRREWHERTDFLLYALRQAVRVQ